MAALVLTAAQILVGSFDATGFTGKVDISPRVVDLVKITNFGSGGYEQFAPSIKSGGLNIEGNADHATGGITTTFTPEAIGTQYAFGVAPTGGAAAGDPAWFSRGYLRDYTPWGGNVGDKGSFQMAAELDTASTIGLVATPLTAKASNSNGGNVDLVGPTATQSLYAALFITSGTFTNLVVKIQSDDNSSFTSATDRITFTSTSAAGWEYKSVAGDLSTETHWRAQWTRGSGTPTFAVFFGVSSTLA